VAYHAYVLRRDAALARASDSGLDTAVVSLPGGRHRPRCLPGWLGGDISLLIRALSGVHFVRGVPEEAAWFTAVIIAGLPVWILPWRQVQVAATPRSGGDEESSSVIRKVYLYFYLWSHPDRAGSGGTSSFVWSVSSWA